MKQTNRRKSLGIQISIVIGLLGFASVALVGLLLSKNSSELLTHNKGTAVAETAFQVVDKLDRGMYERLRDVKVLASLEVIRNPKAPASEKRALLDSLKTSFPDYAFIGLTDANGKITASADGLLQGASVAARPWFIETKASQKPTINDVHEALLLAKLLPNPTNEPLRFVDFSAPVFDEKNNFTGVLGAHLSFSWADNVRTSVLKSTEAKDKVEVFILSPENKVLLGPGSSQGTTFDLSGIDENQAAGQYIIKDGNSNSYLMGYAKSTGYKDYAGFGWKVIVRQPTTTALQAIETNKVTALQIATLVGLLFTLISGFYVRRSLRKEEELERAKDEFVSLVSHQLRTPLSAIRWFSEIASGNQKVLDKEQREALQEIHNSTSSMIALVNTMLNISRIETGRLMIEAKPTDIRELIHRNITNVAPLAKEQKVTIKNEVTQTITLQVDPLLMDQVLHNLLTNAIRYSRQPNAMVHISAKVQQSSVQISVSDNGIGIPANEQKHLFERFYRAENAKKAVDNGSGLGLYLVKIILTQAGGDITVSSEENKGTTFVISLPKIGMKSKKGDRTLT